MKRQSLAPLSIMTAGFILGVSGIAIAVFITTHQPWIGLTFTPTDEVENIAITQVNRNELAHTIVAGTIVGSIEYLDNVWYPITNNTLLPEPDGLKTYQLYNQFLDEQAFLHTLLKAKTLNLLTSEKKVLKIPLQSSRPVSDIPYQYWIVQAGGLFALMLGVAVWSFQKNLIEAKLFFLSGLGYYIMGVVTPVYAYRELALNAELFKLLSAMNQFGGSLLHFSIIALLFIYPIKVMRRQNIKLIAVIILAIWANKVFQFAPVPGHDYYAFFPAIFLTCALALALQWKKTAKLPVERAILKWLMLSVFFTLFMAFLSWYLPHMLPNQASAPLWIAFSIALLMYIGVAFGVSRYRLFSLDRWWFEAWAWFLSGVIVVGVDLILIFVFHLQVETSTLTTLLILGWVYFPLRQWLQQKILSNSRKENYNHLSEITSSLFSTPEPQQISKAFSELIIKTFNPLSNEILDRKNQHPIIQNEGANLLVPIPATEQSLYLTHADKGHVLFKPDHLDTVRSIYSIFDRYSDLINEIQKTAKIERQKIARDLHDDVAANLLTLSHRNLSQEKTRLISKKTLAALKEAISVLDDRQNFSLYRSLKNLRDESIDRVRSCNRTIDFKLLLDGNDILLAGREWVNLKRIISEIITNFIKHSTQGPGYLLIRQNNYHLDLESSNHIALSKKDNHTGRGVLNIKTRAEELNGSASWQLLDKGRVFTLSVRINLKGTER